MIKKIIFISVLTFALIFIACSKNQSNKDIVDKKKNQASYKVLHIMSFHSPWIWTDGQFDGFKSVLKDEKVEYKTLQLNAKVNNKETLEKLAAEASEIIKTWKPDLVYTTDDAALQYVVKKYINSDIPFVFSGVNKSPDYYGFKGAVNIAGVLEHEHYVPTVNLLKQIIPSIKKIAVISDDDDSNWSDIYERIAEKTKKELPDISISGLYKFKTFADYKAQIIQWNKTREIDAVIIVGWFTFKDNNGKNVDQTAVAQWTAENSMIPDGSFWEDRIIKGNLASVTVSFTEQGIAAGLIAKAVLIDGKSPSSFQFMPTLKGQPVINTARAEKLGINISSDILLMSKPVNKFEWDK